MKFLPSFKIITVYLPEDILEWIDDRIQSREFANRTEAIVEAIAEFIVTKKSEMRASPRKKKTPFKDYVKTIKRNLQEGKF